MDKAKKDSLIAKLSRLNIEKDGQHTLQIKHLNNFTSLCKEIEEVRKKLGLL